MTDEPIFLLIETATDICSVAVSHGKKILGINEDLNGHSHAKNLLPFIDEILQQNSLSTNDLTAVVVSSGPGSYTGLRIGVSTAKGIAYTANIPILSVGSLTGIAQSCKNNPDFDDSQNSIIVPMIDARRMEVFTAIFDNNMNCVENISAKIIEDNSFLDLLICKTIFFCGNGMPKCKDILSKSANARFINEQISAKNLLKPALKKWKEKDFEDIAYFEPFYLKEYIAGKPIVKGLCK